MTLGDKEFISLFSMQIENIDISFNLYVYIFVFIGWKKSLL